MKRQREHEEQATVIEWAKLSERKYPELAWIYAIPSGFHRDRPFITKSGKKLPPWSAVFAKREGVKSGVPDLCLPVPRRNCNALYIEMKADMGRPNPNQLIWHDGLASFGNCVRVCYSADEAIKVLQWYLS